MSVLQYGCVCEACAKHITRSHQSPIEANPVYIYTWFISGSYGWPEKWENRMPADHENLMTGSQQRCALNILKPQNLTMVVGFKRVRSANLF